MKPRTIFLATNIRRLRTRKKWSQQELAEKLGVKRGKLALVESGRTINPQLDDVINISAVFGIGIDTLLKVDLRKVTEMTLLELEAGNDAYTMGTNIRIHATSVDSSNIENAEFVPYKAQAGYAGGYADPEYIAALPKFSLPHLSKQRKYRMFPISGDSMLPIPDKSLIVGELVQDWTALPNDSLCIVILKNAGPDFVFKQVENCIKTERKLLLKSFNPEYLPYEAHVSDVLEIWKFNGYFSDTVPGGSITMEQIAQALKTIRTDVEDIKSGRAGFTLPYQK